MKSSNTTSIMGWIYLFIASILELSMTFCIGKTKSAIGTDYYLWISGVVGTSLLNLWFLTKAVQTLPVGMTYVIWTGIGAVGTVIMAILFFKEPVTFARIFFMTTLILSIIGLKVVSN
jgi:multidrug resistance protein, SMR family